MTGMRWITSLFLAIAIAAVAVPAAAQQVPQRVTLTSISDEPLQPKGEAGAPRMFRLALNKAHVVEFSRPISNIVVGNEAIADVYVEPSNPYRVFLISRAIGSTNVFFMDANNRILDQAEIQVLVDSDGLGEAIKKLLPNDQVDVSVYGDSVFLTGTVGSTGQAADAVRIAERFVTDPALVTNMLKVAGSQQVILQVKVAEIDRATRKNLTAETTGLVLDNSSDAFDLNIATTAPNLDSFGTGTLLLDKVSQNLGPVTLDALESQSLVKTLAEPTLTAMSGEQASFLSGGEIAVPTGFDDQGNVTVEYREFGVRLEFTPIVLDKGRISLELVTEVSATDSNNDVTIQNSTFAGFATKRTESTVDMPSGGTIMLSGLLEDNMSDTIRGLPFLKDVPILGTLFRSTEFQLDQTELVVTITAYLADPASGQNALSLPTDGFENASDIDIYLLGRLHREYGPGDRTFWESPVFGPFGYIMQ